MFLDFTPDITLNSQQRTRYVMFRILLWLAFSAMSCYWIASIILPTVRFSHNIQNTDPLYDLTEPKAMGTAVGFSASLAQDVDTVTLSITPTDDVSLEGKRLSLRKSYSAFLSPFTQSTESALSSDKPFPAGSLIRSEREYFIVDDETRYPIATAETLIAAGYDFDAAIMTTSEERSAYTKGKQFTMSATHPVGTIFRDRQSNELFGFTGSELVRNVVNSEGVPEIIVDQITRDDYAACTLSKDFLRKSYSCTTSAGNVDYKGKDFVFMLENTKPHEITMMRATFSLKPTTANIQSRLGLIKQELFK